MTRIILKNSKTNSKRPNPATLVDGEVALNCAGFNDATGLYFRTSPTELIKVGPPSIGAEAPNTNPAGFAGLCVGELWYKTTGTDRGLKLWDGNNWQIAAGLDGATNSSFTALGIEAAATIRGGGGSSGDGSPLFIGYQAGKAMNGTISAIGIGNQALTKATSASQNNIAIGDQSLSNVTTDAQRNTVVGYQAGLNITNANDVVAIGSRALQNAKNTASTSIAIGANALRDATTGLNIAIGANQGVNMTTGTGNVLIGPGHPETGGLTTGSNNVFLGYDSYGIGAASGNMVLANGWRVDAQSSGNVIIGSVPGDTTPNYTLSNNSNNTIIGVMGKNVLAPGASGNTIIGTFDRYFTPVSVNNSLILGNGEKYALLVNEVGAWGMWSSGGIPNYGTAGQILTSQGQYDPPTWKTFTIFDFTGTSFSTTFTSADGQIITVTNGLITNAVRP